MNTPIPPFRRQDAASPRYNQRIADAVNALSMLAPASPESMEILGTPGGRTFNDVRRVVLREIFFGVVTDTGPAGDEDDFVPAAGPSQDRRYWVTRRKATVEYLDRELVEDDADGLPNVNLVDEDAADGDAIATGDTESDGEPEVLPANVVIATDIFGEGRRFAVGDKVLIMSVVVDDPEDGAEPTTPDTEESRVLVHAIISEPVETVWAKLTGYAVTAPPGTSGSVVFMRERRYSWEEVAPRQGAAWINDDSWAAVTDGMFGTTDENYALDPEGNSYPQRQQGGSSIRGGGRYPEVGDVVLLRRTTRTMLLDIGGDTLTQGETDDDGNVLPLTVACWGIQRRSVRSDDVVQVGTYNSTLGVYQNSQLCGTDYRSPTAAPGDPPVYPPSKANVTRSVAAGSGNGASDVIVVNLAELGVGVNKGGWAAGLILPATYRFLTSDNYEVFAVWCPKVKTRTVITGVDFGAETTATFDEKYYGTGAEADD